MKSDPLSQPSSKDQCTTWITEGATLCTMVFQATNAVHMLAVVFALQQVASPDASQSENATTCLWSIGSECRPAPGPEPN